jgi:hypothetical protein
MRFLAVITAACLFCYCQCAIAQSERREPDTQVDPCKPEQSLILGLAVVKPPEQVQCELFRTVEQLGSGQKLLFELQNNAGIIKLYIAPNLARLERITIGGGPNRGLLIGKIDQELARVEADMPRLSKMSEEEVQEYVILFDQKFPNLIRQSDVFDLGSDSRVLVPRLIPLLPSIDLTRNILDPIPNLPVSSDEMKDFLAEINRVIADINLDLQNLLKSDQFGPFNRPYTSSFRLWIPKGEYSKTEPPLAPERASPPFSSNQVAKALQLYQSALRLQRDAFSGLDTLATNLAETKKNGAEHLSTLSLKLDSMTKEKNDAATRQLTTFYRDVINLTTQKDSLALNLFIYLLVAFCVSLVGLHLVIRLFSVDIGKIIFSSNSLLHVFTVFVLITSIVILAMSGKLEGQNLTTLIAAISGYVLGQLGRTTGSTQQASADTADRGMVVPGKAPETPLGVPAE